MAGSDLPAPVQAAQAVARERRIATGLLIGGTWAGMAAIVLTGVLGGSDSQLVMIPSVMTMLWALGNAGRLLVNRERYDQAKNVLAHWEGEKLRRSIATSEPVRMDPEDPRWATIRGLLDRVGAAGDEGLKQPLEAAEKRVRDLLHDVGTLSAAEAAEVASGGDALRLARLQGAREEKDRELERIVHILRDLNVELAVRDTGTGDLVKALQSILGKVAAEVEIVDMLKRAPISEETTAPRNKKPGQRESS